MTMCGWRVRIDVCLRFVYWTLTKVNIKTSLEIYGTDSWISMDMNREQITFDKCNKMLLFIQNLMKIWEFKPNKVEKGIQKVCERI